MLFVVGSICDADAAVMIAEAATDLFAAGKKLLLAADLGDADLAMDGYDDLRAAVAKAERRAA